MIEKMRGYIGELASSAITRASREIKCRRYIYFYLPDGFPPFNQLIKSRNTHIHLSYTTARGKKRIY